MSRDTDRKEPMPNPSQRPRLSGFSPEVEEWMRHRTREIQRATQRRGMPISYGVGKERLKIPPPPPRPGQDP